MGSEIGKTGGSHSEQKQCVIGRVELRYLSGYYCSFVPNYSGVCRRLLTELTKKGVPDPVQWTEPRQQAFTQVKVATCGGPHLHSFELH